MKRACPLTQWIFLDSGVEFGERSTRCAETPTGWRWICIARAKIGRAEIRRFEIGRSEIRRPEEWNGRGSGRRQT